MAIRRREMAYAATATINPSKKRAANPSVQVLVVERGAQHPSEGVTDEHRDSKSGDGQPQLNGGLVAFDQTSSHDDRRSDQEDVRQTEQRRLLQRGNQLDDVDHGKAHEQHDPGCPQDGGGDRVRGRVIERRGAAPDQYASADGD